MRCMESMSFFPGCIAIGKRHFQEPDEYIFLVEDRELFGENLFDDRGHVNDVVLGRAESVGRDAIVGRVPVSISAALEACNGKPIDTYRPLLIVPCISVAKDTADPTNGTQYGIELAFFSRRATPDVDRAC